MAQGRDQIMARLSNVFRDVFDDDDLQLNEKMTTADVKGWDSLMHITLLVAIEAEFGIRIKPGEAGELSDVGELADLIARRS